MRRVTYQIKGNVSAAKIRENKCGLLPQPDSNLKITLLLNDLFFR
jgi:hypothetical protein